MKLKNLYSEYYEIKEYEITFNTILRILHSIFKFSFQLSSFSPPNYKIFVWSLFLRFACAPTHFIPILGHCPLFQISCYLSQLIAYNLFLSWACQLHQQYLILFLSFLLSSCAYQTGGKGRLILAQDLQSSFRAIYLENRNCFSVLKVESMVPDKL